MLRFQKKTNWLIASWVSLMAVAVVFATPDFSLAQKRYQPKKIGTERVKGLIVGKTNHSVLVRTEEGKIKEVLFQDEGVDMIPLGEAITKVPAKISVKGTVPVSALRPGVAVKFTAEMKSKGSIDGKIENLTVLPSKFQEMGVQSSSGAVEPDFPHTVNVKGVIKKAKDGNFQLEVPKSFFASNKKLVFKTAEDAVVSIDEKSMREVRVGDTVERIRANEYSGGELIARDIRVNLSKDHKSVQTDPDDVLMLKYRHLSDKPRKPTEIRTEHFVIKTDLSVRSTKIMLDKLERMYSIVSKYYAVKKIRRPIHCYVVEDIKKWREYMTEIQPGLESILGRAGVTIGQPVAPGRLHSTVYSCGDHKVVQHEAVHCFCQTVFGGAGPTWYAEGMAELGCYWRPGELEVNLEPIMIRYLTSARRPSLQELVRVGQVTGDSWKAYAWRWALCYMLVNNPNYNKPFYELGVAMMRQDAKNIPEGMGRKNFYTAFKDKAPEIIFEYQQFLEGLGNGYRADLCRWNWKLKGANLKKKRMSKATIVAKGGWQPSRAKLHEGEQYELVAKGDWSTPLAKKVSADGAEDGRAKLIGTILVVTKLDDKVVNKSYSLSDEIELGKRIVFTAPATGQLYLRCRGKLAEVAKNSGQLTVYVRRKKKK